MTWSGGQENAEAQERDWGADSEMEQMLESLDIDALRKEAEKAALEELRSLGPEAFRDWSITGLLTSHQTSLRLFSSQSSRSSSEGGYMV